MPGFSGLASADFEGVFAHSYKRPLNLNFYAPSVYRTPMAAPTDCSRRLAHLWHRVACWMPALGGVGVIW